MERVRRHDPRALETLYSRYASSALVCADRMLNDRCSAEEVVQEAFWRVWRKSDAFATRRGPFCAWLFGIIHHLAIDELRRRRSRPPLALNETTAEAIAEMPDGNRDVDDAAISLVTGDQVRQALMGLPDELRSVVELAYFQGLTHREIAKKLGQPLGTIHTRARTALFRLKESLSPLEIGELG